MPYHNHTNWKITRLRSIRMPVTNVKLAMDWYMELLGLKLLESTHETAELAVVEDEMVIHPTLILMKTNSSHRLNYYKNGRLRSMVMMHASNLEGLRDKMLMSGAEVTMPHSDQDEDGCGRFFEATDPSGNIIQIQANAGEAPSEHVRVEAIFNLDFPVADVRKSARFYAEMLGFNLIREPDDQLAIVKTGPYYKSRFGYHDVQEFGFFLFHHGEKNVLHFEDTSGTLQECLILQVEDAEALYKRLVEHGSLITESRKDDVGRYSFQLADPNGNLIKVQAKGYSYGHFVVM